MSKPKTIADHIEDAEDLISHIGKWSYDGSPIAALIDHAQATLNQPPYPVESLTVDEIKGAYRAQFPHSVEWPDTELTIALLQEMGLSIVWTASLPVVAPADF